MHRQGDSVPPWCVGLCCSRSPTHKNSLPIARPWKPTPEPPLGITSGWGPSIGILCLSFWLLFCYWLVLSGMSCFFFRRTSRTKPATVVQFFPPWSMTPMMLSGDICPRAVSRSWRSCAHLSHLKKVWRASSLGSPQYKHCGSPTFPIFWRCDRKSLCPVSICVRY